MSNTNTWPYFEHSKRNNRKQPNAKNPNSMYKVDGKPITLKELQDELGCPIPIATLADMRAKGALTRDKIKKRLKLI